METGPIPAVPICQLHQGREEMKRQTEQSPEERNPSVTGRESISGPRCPGAWPHPPSRSGTTGSRSSRSPPPGTAAWCSPSADTYEPAGSETRPGERREHGYPDGHGMRGHPPPRQGQSSGSRLWGKKSPQKRSSLKVQGLSCSSPFVPRHGPGSEQQLKINPCWMDGWTTPPVTVTIKYT